MTFVKSYILYMEVDWSEG